MSQADIERLRRERQHEEKERAERAKRYERNRPEIERLDREIDETQKQREDEFKDCPWEGRYDEVDDYVIHLPDDRYERWNELIKKQEKARERREKLHAAPQIAVPDGAMEWLLHETGHWLASTPSERAMPGYGIGQEEWGHAADREWEAWAFETIVLAPFGEARSFAPPTQRDGVCFAKAGPMPAWALASIERRIAEERVDVAAFRSLFAEWITWGKSKRAKAPWESPT